VTLIWMEGFELPGNNTDYNDNDWIAPYQAVNAFGRYGGKAGQWAGGAVASVAVPANPTYVCGMAYFPTGVAPNSDRYIMQFFEGATPHVYLTSGNDVAAIPQVKRGNGTVLGTCAMSPMVANQWYHFQMKVVVHDTTGSVEVRLNGAVVFSATNIDTRNGGVVGTIDTIGWRGDFTAYFDDMWIDNSAFLGDCKIEPLRPTGAGDSTDFTPSAGSNWQNVDDTSPNGDTDYNHSNTVGHKDLFALNNLATVAGTVLGVQMRFRGRKDDAGSRTVKGVLKTGGVEFDSAGLALGDNYLGKTDVLHVVNPDTTAAWTIAEVNALQAGYEVEA
jgi:hypothetical protein